MMCAVAWMVAPITVFIVLLVFLHLIGKGTLCNKARDDLEHALAREYEPEVRAILGMRGTYLTKENREYALNWIAVQERREADHNRKAGMT